MAKMLFELAVEMEDGTAYRVVADQRDVGRWEAQPFGWPLAQIEEKLSTKFFRYLGWSASLRQQKTTLTWLDFDAKCVDVSGVDDEESDVADDAADPGRPAA